MSKKEQQRVVVIAQVEQGVLTGEEGAELMGLSVRQVRRLVAGYRRHGVAALAHGNRGRRPARAVPQEVKDHVLALAQGAYAGCNQCHLRDVLAEREGLMLSRSTVRRILTAAGLHSPRRRRPPAHRARRERYPQEGMLLQIDGSPHDWLEGRGPRLVLLGAIDDATGTVPGAVFWEREDHWGYMEVLRQVTQSKGLPVALYSDRHGVFWRWQQHRETVEEQLEGKREPTQVARILEELGIGLLHARSPQAKGRIERLWKTLQDRLLVELRWAGAATQAEANALLTQFLPRFNARFGVAAAQPQRAYRPWPQALLPQRVFCLKERRTVATDNTLRWRGHVWQVLSSPQRASYARARVEVQELLDGTITVIHDGAPLRIVPAPARPVTPGRPLPRTNGTQPQTIHRPAANHPWRTMVTFSRTT